MRVLVEGEHYMYESDDEQVGKIKYLKNLIASIYEC